MDEQQVEQLARHIAKELARELAASEHFCRFSDVDPRELYATMDWVKEHRANMQQMKAEVLSAVMKAAIPTMIIVNVIGFFVGKYIGGV